MNVDHLPIADCFPLILTDGTLGILGIDAISCAKIRKYNGQRSTAPASSTAKKLSTKTTRIVKEMLSRHRGFIMDR